MTASRSRACRTSSRGLALAALDVALLSSAPGLAGAEVVRIVPAAASVPGRNGTLWRTELRLLNPLSAAAEVKVSLLGSAEGGAGREATLTVPAGRVLTLPDVVGTTLGASGGGALRVVSDGGLVVTTRTSNEGNSCGSVGVAIGAVSAASGLTRALVPHLSNDPALAGSRSNVGFVNPGATAAEVAWTLRDGGTGESMGQGSLTLGPLGRAQVDDVFAAAGAAGRAVPSAFLEVRSTQPVIAYGTAVRNDSGDAAFFLGVEAPTAAGSAEWWQPFFTFPKGRGLSWRVEDGFRITGTGGPPRVIVLPDGTYRLFYNGPGVLLSASSRDALTFTPDAGTRMRGGDPAVVYLKAGGYRFLVSDGPQGQRVLRSFVSSDGLTFTQEPGVRYQPAPTDAGLVEVPHAVKLADGRWRLYYVGDWFGQGGSASRNNTRSAISTDEGLTWTPEKGSELTLPETVDPDVVTLEDGSFRLYHKKFESFYAVDDADGAGFASGSPRPVLDARDRVDPTLLRLPDGTLRLFFGTVGGMGSAVATD